MGSGELVSYCQQLLVRAALVGGARIGGARSRRDMDDVLKEQGMTGENAAKEILSILCRPAIVEKMIAVVERQIISSPDLTSVQTTAEHVVRNLLTALPALM